MKPNGNSSGPVGREAAHIYVHVPFCTGRCMYCGFYSTTGDEEFIPSFIKALKLEMWQGLDPDGWQRRNFEESYPDAPEDPLCFDESLHLRHPPENDHRPETIYVGGGTPSSLRADQLQCLCQAITERLATATVREFTVEANPGTLSTDKLDVLRQFGANRISLGVQSLDDSVLRTIGRRHSARNVADTMKLLRDTGISNIGIDLIAGLPGVDEYIWKSTLESVLRLAPEHIAVYALSVEPDSKLAALPQMEIDKWKPAEDSIVAALETAERILCSDGFLRYEISNFARPGRESQHNLAYWRGCDYLGFGPSASSRSGLRRWTNRPDLRAYIKALSESQPAPAELETVSTDADKIERLMFSFRLLNEGTCLLDYGTPDDAAKWEPILVGLAARNLVCKRNCRWFLTAQGRLLADEVARELLP